MIVNPAPGALVRDPATRLAIADGTEVDHTMPYFSRLLADGDLVNAEAPEPETAEAPEQHDADEPADLDEPSDPAISNEEPA